MSPSSILVRHRYSLPFSKWRTPHGGAWVARALGVRAPSILLESPEPCVGIVSRCAGSSNAARHVGRATLATRSP